MPETPNTQDAQGGGGDAGGKGTGKGTQAPREVRTLSLVKGQQRFCFRYELGDEPKVLDALVEMVNRRDLPFDWFDAAVLSHQLGQHLAKELKGFLPKKAA
jgi:hypothetical protein